MGTEKGKNRGKETGRERNGDIQDFHAEPPDAVDRAGITAFRASMSTQAARQLIFVVRRLCERYFVVVRMRSNTAFASIQRRAK